MNQVEMVIELAKEFMKRSRFVTIEHEEVIALANKMLETGIKPFPSETTGENKYLLLWKEMAASAINYCYWYGRADIRPNDASSTKMYDLVNKSIPCSFNGFYLPDSIAHLKRLLAQERFPLLEERCRHLDELIDSSWFVGDLAESDGKYFSTFFEALVVKFPGFGSDIFLKRASLFFLQLYRKFGWYADDMKLLHVPADYQVPKMLKHFGCFKYDYGLQASIEHQALIPKHSRPECEIRAATIIVCEILKKETGWNISDIDSWLWLRRKECNDPFHLTVTTDY